MKKILVSLILLLPFLLKSQILEVSGIQEGLWDCDTVLVIKDVILPEYQRLPSSGISAEKAITRLTILIFFSLENIN